MGGDAIGEAALIVFGYFLGTLPFTVALAAAHGLDPAEEADLHIAIRRSIGWPQAAAAVLVDISKGIFPVLIGFGFSLPVWAVAAGGVAAVVGQMWPPLRGHGEKGNSTGVGALVALALVYASYAALVSLAFFAVGGLVRLMTIRSSSPERQRPDHPLSLMLPAGMLAGFAAAPVVCGLTGSPADLTAALWVMVGAIAVRRLTAGLRADLSVGARMGPVLLRRLLFDQSLIERDW